MSSPFLSRLRESGQLPLAVVECIHAAERNHPSGALSYTISEEEGRDVVVQLLKPTITVSKDEPCRSGMHWYVDFHDEKK
ncbi:MAG TPA: hypothetical protein VNL71_20355 [Chloroflexota bacterium]|nr:hypothetical protein [Chloroflexota bacterium]